MIEDRLNPNELSPELLSINALNFAPDSDSSARSVMFGSHFTQRLVVDGANEKRIQTGVEKDLGRYTFAVKMPVDGRIVKIIPRYPPRMDNDSIPQNPETLVIYEDDATKEYGCVTVPYYASFHQSFGFRYEIKQAFRDLTPGTFVPKGTVFADSPAVRENGGYAYGIELNMCLMSHPAVSEDGILISRDVLPRLKFRTYENRTVECGVSEFPLNMYGNHEKYKPFPEIGDYIRDDGILMSLRSYSTDLMPVEVGIFDAMEHDSIFDKPVYVRGKGGRVVDIKIYHDDSEQSPMPDGIMNGVDKYHRALKQYYNELIKLDKDIRRDRQMKFGDSKVRMSPELHRMIVEGKAITNEGINKSSQKLNLHFRKTPINAYHIEFVIEYEIIPTDGFKLTDTHGNFH